MSEVKLAEVKTMLKRLGKLRRQLGKRIAGIR
jgi:hypothetical protein